MSDLDPCHCGSSVLAVEKPEGWENYNPGLRWNYCHRCAKARCDAYPGACVGADMPATSEDAMIVLLRAMYAWVDQYPSEGYEDPARVADFDRWLAAHDAQVRAEAWEQGQTAGLAQKLMGDISQNPYAQNALISDKENQ